MVTHENARYIGGTDGAPPIPPPGGYRGAKRVADPPPASEAAEPTKPLPWLGMVALIVAILFALVLLGTMAIAGAAPLFGVNLLVLQLLVIGVVVAALVIRRGRRLGAAALAIVLICNVGTLGALAASRTMPDGTTPGAYATDPKLGYPGIRGVDEQMLLGQPSLETVQQDTDELMAEIRDEVTRVYGLQWVEIGTPQLRPERNGFGGESLLQRYTSSGWYTTTPITDVAQKRRVMGTVDAVIQRHYDRSPMIALNEETSGLSAHSIQKLYGSDDPATQAVWSWYSYSYTADARVYADIDDLTHDDTGVFRQAREAQHARTGEPLEALSLQIIGTELLSEGDVAAFREGTGR